MSDPSLCLTHTFDGRPLPAQEVSASQVWASVPTDSPQPNGGEQKGQQGTGGAQAETNFEKALRQLQFDANDAMTQELVNIKQKAAKPERTETRANGTK